MSDFTEVLVPQMNPNDDRAVLVRWHVSSGSWVQADQALATLETSKVTFDVNAPREGYVFFEQQPKTSVTVGSAFAWLSPDNLPPPAAISRGEETQDGLKEDAARFTRKALKLMKELGLREADFGSTERVDVAAVEHMARNRHGTHIDAASQTVEPLEQSSTKSSKRKCWLRFTARWFRARWRSDCHAKRRSGDCRKALHKPGL